MTGKVGCAFVGWSSKSTGLVTSPMLWQPQFRERDGRRCTIVESTMAKRAGVTRKVSLSVHEEDLRLLKDRAKRVHHGNVSAVFAELIARIRREEALRSAFEWYGEPIVLTDEDRAR